LKEGGKDGWTDICEKEGGDNNKLVFCCCWEMGMRKKKWKIKINEIKRDQF